MGCSDQPELMTCSATRKSFSAPSKVSHGHPWHSGPLPSSEPRHSLSQLLRVWTAGGSLIKTPVGITCSQGQQLHAPGQALSRLTLRCRKPPVDPAALPLRSSLESGPPSAESSSADTAGCWALLFPPPQGDSGCLSGNPGETSVPRLTKLRHFYRNSSHLSRNRQSQFEAKCIG